MNEGADGKKDLHMHLGHFIYNGPHKAKECPKRKGKVTTLELDDSNNEPMQLVALLQALGAMRSECLKYPTACYSWTRL